MGVGRVIIDLNDDWVFFDSDVGLKKASSGKGEPKISLPHTTKILPYHNFDEKEYQIISWYRKEFTIPKELRGKRVFIEFDGVMVYAEVYINGKKVGSHKGGFTPFRFDVTRYVKPSGKNIIAVKVDSRERTDIPPFGGVVDYLTFSGIYREVRAIFTDAVYIDDIFPYALNILKNDRTLLCQYDIVNTSNKRELEVKLALKDKDKVIAENTRSIVVGKGKKISENIVLQNISEIILWDIDNPYLYTVELSLIDNGKVVDVVSKPFGFREAHFAKDGGFYLNGKRIKLVGLDRHQNYPFIGAAAGKKLQYRDAEILKNELKLNIVRTSHYPQSPHFLDRCDQIGLLVFEEIPGWQHIGDKKWKEVSLNELKEMIIRDRHHPSIILWGVRINESQDDDEFYTKTNELAHLLDPTRQTGGVRCFRESNFLEDVFTFNDFSGSVLPPNHIPYLITEFAGHTFPTKSFDNVQKQIEHALLHTRIQNKQLGIKEIAGAIGWCAFDYNTHKEFGSGDRICYHGVCDIFRFPKLAAFFYKSQVSPDREVVLEIADFWARGDWNGYVKYLVIFSNCDEVEVVIGKRKIGKFQAAKERFRNLRYPPFIVDKMSDRWGQEWEDLTLIGYIKGKRVAKKMYPADKIPVKLESWLDHNELIADGRDTTWLRFMMADKYGNICPYATGIVSIRSKKKLVRFIGENPFALVGGKGAIFVRSTTKRGVETIELLVDGKYRAEVKIKLV